MYQKSKIQNYYLKQQNYFLNQELTLKQNEIDKHLDNVSVKQELTLKPISIKIDKLLDKVSVKILITLKKRKESHHQDTSYKFKNSDVSPTNCRLIEQ